MRRIVLLLGSLLVLATSVAAGLAYAAVTPTNPPARPTINGFEITAVRFSAGACDADYEVKAGAATVGTVQVQVRTATGDTPTGGVGLRYTVTGEVERFTKLMINDAQLTVANCFAAFAAAAGGFGPKSAALEAWHQARGLVPQ